MIDIPKTRMQEFFRHWKVAELAIFGSAVRNELGPDSDIDLIISFHPGTHHTLFDLIEMQQELEGIFGRKVDLIERRALEKSENYLRRRQILQSAEIIDVA